MKLAADYYPPLVVSSVAGEMAPGVLFLHMYGGSRADWAPLARQLQAQGIAALALDFRGAGASPGPDDWNKSRTTPVLPGRPCWLSPSMTPQCIPIVGASVGANLALVVGAKNTGVAAVVALSPGDDFLGVAPASALGGFASRPVYLIASQDDAYSYATVQHMAPHLAAGETYFYTTSGHGMAMFSKTDLAQRLLTWLGATSVHFRKRVTARALSARAFLCWIYELLITNYNSPATSSASRLKYSSR